jgi:hypothetical protein
MTFGKITFHLDKISPKEDDHTDNVFLIKECFTRNGNTQVREPGTTSCYRYGHYEKTSSRRIEFPSEKAMNDHHDTPLSSHQIEDGVGHTEEITERTRYALNKLYLGGFVKHWKRYEEQSQLAEAQQESPRR